ncbi:MAG: T9SS type A sorting domain-containing protein [Candidatus Tenebribacter burtonii]|nr:T9SS type A sorting domain-containing protein [Candidatus Tenebribacter burtonii]
MKVKMLLLFLILVSQLFCQIVFYIETDETNYSYGQDIYITFNLHNTSADTVIVTFLSSYPFGYYIDEELFIIGSFGVVFDVIIPPDSTFSSIPYVHTDNVSNGNHILVGEFHCLPPYLVSDPISITIGQVDADFYKLQQIGFQLSNYPNLFNPSTTIEFSIQNGSEVDISIYNIKGQKIKTLIHNEFDKGDHSIIWNGDDESGKLVGSGVYLYKLQTESITETKKMLMMK